MARTMDGKAVRAVIREMRNAGTNMAAQRAMARLALTRPNLTPCGRAAWQSL